MIKVRIVILRVISKTIDGEGAEWIKTNWDPKWHDLIDRAWSGRPNPALSVNRPTDPNDLQKTVDFVQEILGEARKLLVSFGLDTDEAHHII